MFREAITASGVSQAALARAAGVNRSTVRRWLAGHDIKSGAVEKMLEVCGLTLATKPYSNWQIQGPHFPRNPPATPDELAEAGMRTAVYHRWRNRKQDVLASTIEKLLIAQGVSVGRAVTPPEFVGLEPEWKWPKVFVPWDSNSG